MQAREKVDDGRPADPHPREFRGGGGVPFAQMPGLSKRFVRLPVVSLEPVDPSQVDVELGVERSSIGRLAAELDRPVEIPFGLRQTIPELGPVKRI